MTENITKYGCISKSLEKFLLYDNDKIRKKRYGPLKSAKYYERIVNGVKASFEDHFIVMNNLPEEYLKKINFEEYYKSVKSRKVSKKIFKKWSEQPPNKLLQEIIEIFYLVYINLEKYPEIKTLAEPDFNNVNKWLHLMQIIQKKGIKNLKNN